MKWNDELRMAIRAVRLASGVCQSVQKRTVKPEALVKKDRSPVTVADFASQATVSAILPENSRLVAEEDASYLRPVEHAALRAAVVEHVSNGLGQDVDQAQVLDWIDRGSRHEDAKTLNRFWTLDPIDGTKGFLRGEQYAVALALIHRGEIELGVLGCPNLAGTDGVGLLLVAAKGEGAWQLSIQGGDDAQPIAVSDVSTPADARFCESVESAHTQHSDAAKIAKRLGITAEPLRMDSQAKYAALAKGEASIYLRMPTSAEYREKIWDHAAGFVVVQEAGGRVTDISGAPLDFSYGHRLERNHGIIASNDRFHDILVEAVRKTAVR